MTLESQIGGTPCVVFGLHGDVDGAQIDDAEGGDFDLQLESGERVMVVARARDPRDRGGRRAVDRPAHAVGGALYAPLSRVDWATLLRRTFDVDVTRCTGCAGRMTVRAVVTDPASIDRLLAALRRSRDPPVAA